MKNEIEGDYAEAESDDCASENWQDSCLLDECRSEKEFMSYRIASLERKNKSLNTVRILLYAVSITLLMIVYANSSALQHKMLFDVMISVAVTIMFMFFLVQASDFVQKIRRDRRKKAHRSFVEKHRH